MNGMNYEGSARSFRLRAYKIDFMSLLTNKSFNQELLHLQSLIRLLFERKNIIFSMALTGLTCSITFPWILNFLISFKLFFRSLRCGRLFLREKSIFSFCLTCSAEQQKIMKYSSRYRALLSKSSSKFNFLRMVFLSRAFAISFNYFLSQRLRNFSNVLFPVRIRNVTRSVVTGLSHGSSSYPVLK